MYVFRLKMGTFAFPETSNGAYKAALLSKAYGISGIFIERNPPNNDFSKYMKQSEKVDHEARVKANKIMTPKQAFYLHFNYDLIIESAARKILKKKVDLKKYRIDLA